MHFQEEKLRSLIFPHTKFWLIWTKTSKMDAHNFVNTLKSGPGNEECCFHFIEKQDRKKNLWNTSQKYKLLFVGLTLNILFDNVTWPKGEPVMIIPVIVAIFIVVVVPFVFSWDQ